jgi:hypothetical protein
MSNKRKLRLKSYTPPRRAPVIQGMGIIPPDQRDSERCQFHPDCCDMDDFDCPGCGQPACVFIIFSNDRHLPFCAEHMEAAAAVSAEHRDQVNARNQN